MPGPSLLSLSGRSVAIADVVAVARHGQPVELAQDAVEAIERSCRLTASLESQAAPVYGLSTGFGALASLFIAPELRTQLQFSLIRSHAATTGPPVEDEVVRAMILLRARSLAMGYSGVRVDVVNSLLGLLNSGWTPVVGEYGSLGCSGDLAPLAHVALGLMGEGTVRDADGRELLAAAALAEADLEPLVLGPKEGLALINGTDGMLGMLCLACEDAALFLRSADIGAAMSVEALLGTDQVFVPELQALRPHPGQAVSAGNLLRLLENSAIVASHQTGDPRVQDAYSLRCAPQVLGAARDTLDHVRTVVQRELISAIDNPVVLPDGRVASCGNFHGAPLGYVADFLAIALADVASIAERRIDRLLDPSRSQGLPPFLAADPGVDSGLMLAQYTAAALVSECRRLAVPASTDSIPTSAMQEDHVSMGWAATRKLRRVLDALARVIGIEALTAARALELRAPLRPAPATTAAAALVGAWAGGFGPDRFLAPEIAAAGELVASGSLLEGVEAAIGPLG